MDHSTTTTTTMAAKALDKIRRISGAIKDVLASSSDHEEFYDPELVPDVSESHYEDSLQSSQGRQSKRNRKPPTKLSDEQYAESQTNQRRKGPNQTTKTTNRVANKSKGSSTTANVCFSCEKPTSKLAYCGRCGESFCLECMGMSEAEYRLTSKKPNLILSCAMCLDKVLRDVKEGFDVERRCEEYLQNIDSRLLAVENRLATKVDVKDVRKEVESQISSVVIEKLEKTVEKTVNEKVVNTVKGAIASQVDTAVKEKMLQQVKRDNLVFFNVPESDCMTGLDRKTEDEESITDLLQDHLNINLPAGDLNPLRLGTKKESGPRPLKIKVLNKKVRMDILKKAHTLSSVNTEDEWVKSVHIAQDLTEQQRKEGKELREARDKKRREAAELGDTDKLWVIRKGKVVQIPKPSKRDQLPHSMVEETE